VCRQPGAELLRGRGEIARDLREATWSLDDPRHAEPAAVYSCWMCRSLFRDPNGPPVDGEAAFSNGEYSEPELDRLRERELADLRHDARWLRMHGVRPGARLLEVGSYAGAFLDYARDVGAEAVGVDVDPNIAAYCRRHGHDVRTEAVSAESLGSAFDSAWVLNCFEQLPDPDAVLQELGLVIRREGTLVIRTPSAEFVRLAHQSRLAPLLRPVADASGLLGVPFERVFSAPAIVRLLRVNGFTVTRLRGREYTALVARERSSRWGLHRRARVALYAVASARTGRRLHPWFDVIARAEA
jgi:SAM-dependent methyltransferase